MLKTIIYKWSYTIDMTNKEIKRVFCSYAHTGENMDDVRPMMKLIVDILKENHFNSYCDLFDKSVDNLSEPDQFINSALGQLANCDALLVVQTSSRRSEGMLIEIGAALVQHKPIFLLQNKSAIGSTYIDKLSKRTVNWDSQKDIDNGIRSLFNFSKVNNANNN